MKTLINKSPDHILKDCKFGIKALHNMLFAREGFQKLFGLQGSIDDNNLSSYYCWAVINYSKPFTTTKYNN